MNDTDDDDLPVQNIPDGFRVLTTARSYVGIVNEDGIAVLNILEFVFPTKLLLAVSAVKACPLEFGNTPLTQYQ
jgi:hypothetical protein